MIHNHTSRALWRIAPAGTQECYLVRVLADGTHATVANRVGTGWAKKPSVEPVRDLFDTRAEARAEYRARKAVRAQHAIWPASTL